MPVYLLEFSRDDLSDTTPTWVNITAYFLEGGFQRGSSGPDLDEPQAGTASFTLDNRDRRFEPEYASGSYYPDIRPLRRIRLSIDGTVEFTGFVTSWGQEPPDGAINQEAVVSAVDAQEILNLDTLPALDPPDASSYDEVVNFDEPFGYYRLNEPAGTKMTSVVKTVRRKGRRRRVRRRFEVTAAELGGVSGPTGTYKNTPTLGVPGLILGDSDTAVHCERDSLEAAEVPVEVENFKNVEALSVEAWAKFNGTAGDDTLVAGPKETGGTFSIFQLSLSGGKPKFVIIDSAFATRDVNSSTTVVAGDVYHLVGTWDGQTQILYANGVEVARAARGGLPLAVPDANPKLYIGREASGATATNWMDGVIDEPAVYEKALTPERVLAHYQAGAQRGFPEQTAAARVAATAANTLWTVTTAGGNRELQPVMQTGQPRTEEIREALRAEWPHSQFYVNGSGNPTYLGWEYQATGSYNTVQATFGDTAGEIPYENLTLAYDDDALYNDVTVSRNGGVAQTVEDAISQGRYYRRGYELTGTLNTDDADANTIANAILEEHKEPGLRATSFVLNGADTAALAEIRNREPGDLVRVKRRPKGGTAIDRVARIRSKQVTIPRGHYNNPPIGSFTLSRGFNAALSEWQLGIAGFSELNSTAVLA